MVTDWWPEQTGRLSDGLTITCICGAAVTEGAPVKFGTSALSCITVINAVGVGDGWGIALKATTTAGDPLPVMVYGIYKLATSGAAIGVVTQGSFVVNSVITGVCCAGTGYATTMARNATSGASYILGLAMQSATAAGDSIAVFVGCGA
jgi:hypothetical protein